MSENMKPVCEEKGPLTDELLRKMNAYWRATNYLAAGQLYLLDNPLLREPLTMEQITKKIVLRFARTYAVASRIQRNGHWTIVE